MMYELIDFSGEVVGTIKVEGDIGPQHLGYNIIAAADTDTSFTFEQDGKKWTGIRVRKIDMV